MSAKELVETAVRSAMDQTASLIQWFYLSLFLLDSAAADWPAAMRRN